MPHETFTIMTFAARSGEFASGAGLDDLGGYLGLDFDVVYGPTAVVLEATAIDGDATLNATVDVFDLAALANNYGLSGRAWSDADFTGDGVVDVFDLAVLANNYGAGGGRRCRARGVWSEIMTNALRLLAALLLLLLFRGNHI